MKAIVRTKYGSADVLKLKDIEKPTPKENEVLVKIYAAAVNPLDKYFMRGTPFFIRFVAGLVTPKYKTPGADIAGQVEAVGENVTQFQPGDEVYGDIHNSGFAEYARVPEKLLVLKPANVSFEEAAAIPVAGLTAVQILRDQMQIKPGQKILINGASGGVGTYAVQIAKHYGADVTGVCSTGNVDMVRSIGADQVTDYTKEDFTQSGEFYDLILDNVGNRSVSELKRILAPNGMYLLNAFSPALMLQLGLQSGKSKNGGQVMRNSDVAKAIQSDLEFLKELFEAGTIKSVIDKVYPLSETPEAVRHLESGRARGKIIIAI
ncbi:MAG: NAD(P)-dependent alcohol dehydrogenase [Anaerolineales bacterium]|nr:NAD(P)-dependent alcohol dehydrogenase [Chloroflexota bacterium]MBL6981627.1 NAD(P)-dependent alcohol dehydrogenase [Anaerolineales bacterium]